jgi:phosphoribosylpyrophosphate synthetase
MLQHAIKNTLAKLDRVKIRGTVEGAHVVGPDAEAERWARVMAEKPGTEYAILEKRTWRRRNCQPLSPRCSSCSGFPLVPFEISAEFHSESR